MAKEKPNNERTEREFQLDVNQAVANTEGEIFEDALGDDPFENDGDISLEEMGEGLEGDDLEDEEEPKEADEEKADEEAEGDEEEQAEGDEPEAEADEDDEEEQPRDQQGRFEDRQPPDRRDVPLKAERDRRRDAEERAAETERKLAEALGRIDELSRRVNAPPPQVEQPRPRPDIFADPEGHDQWLIDKLKKDNDEYVNQRIQAYEQQQQRLHEQRVAVNLEQAARSGNGRQRAEFREAYDRLVSLDKMNPQNQALVRRIWDSSDPSREILNWFEDNGADEFREEVYGEPSQRNRGNSRQRSQQPRHETRLPESLRRSPPSLNSARGGQRQEVQDPEMMDDSDDSVFRFAARR